MKKYLIFDLDWTLIDSSEIIDKKIFWEVKKINKEAYKKAKSIAWKNQWLWLKDFFDLIFEWIDIEINTEDFAKEVYKKILKKEKKIKYLPWVIKEIKKLRKDYRLFLTTWSSTKFAKDMLKIWWIKKYFEKIKWSSKIAKWISHLEEFREITKDKDFFEYSVYIWDWDKDRDFAQEAWIDFIHIWDLWQDKYEIPWVKFIEKPLKKLKKDKPKKIKEEIVYESPYRKIIKKDYLVKNNKTKSYIIASHWDKKRTWTMVLPITKSWDIIYISEFRYWREEYTLSFPAWILEENLWEVENVKKELIEETWYKTKDIEFIWETIVEYYNDTTMKYFIARDCKSWKQDLENWEYIEVKKTTKKEFEKLIKKWKIKCPMTISCWFFAKDKI